QVVKTGDNTPLQSTEALLPAKGGDVQLSVDGARVPLLNSGAVAPVLVTPVTCTIESGKNDIIDFGQVRRNTGGNYDWKGNQLAQVNQPLSVSCQPAPTDKATYQVTISYNGEVYSGRTTFLKTSISDLFISGVLLSGADRHMIEFSQGQSLPLAFDAGTGRFTGNVDWALKNYSKTGQAPEEYGNFTATATYTVDVN
ncbi:type 1 fimbrial protein, partial [Salmonella enterica]|nr:type 1 fimbrial protein [Salmonella enterica]